MRLVAFEVRGKVPGETVIDVSEEVRNAFYFSCDPKDKAHEGAPDMPCSAVSPNVAMIDVAFVLEGDDLAYLPERVHG